MHHPTTPTARAGNGTRTRDPNLGKVVLYQLSYSRRPRNRSEQPPSSHRSEPSESMLQPRCWKGIRGDGGEGNRTPDLLNAIQALSQLSYAPRRRSRAVRTGLPSGTAKYSHVYIACQRNGSSENVCGQYFAAPLGSSPTSKRTADPSRSRLLTVEMRRMQHHRRRS